VGGHHDEVSRGRCQSHLWEVEDGKSFVEEILESKLKPVPGRWGLYIEWGWW
jgi:hypothetical protein